MENKKTVSIFVEQKQTDMKELQGYKRIFDGDKMKFLGYVKEEYVQDKMNEYVGKYEEIGTDIDGDIIVSMKESEDNW